MICPIDAYYIVYDAYCKEVGVNTLLNDHPLAKYFGVLLILASQNQHNNGCFECICWSPDL